MPEGRILRQHFFCNFKFHLSFNTGTLLSYLFVPAINYNLKKDEAADHQSQTSRMLPVPLPNLPQRQRRCFACALVIPCVVINAKSSGRRTYVRTYVEQQGREDPEVSVHHPADFSLEDDSKNSQDTPENVFVYMCM